MSADIGAVVKRNDTPCIQVSCFNQSVLALVKEVTYISVSDFVIITNLDLGPVRSNGLEFGRILSSVCHFAALLHLPSLPLVRIFTEKNLKKNVM